MQLKGAKSAQTLKSYGFVAYPLSLDNLNIFYGNQSQVIGNGHTTAVFPRAY